MTINELIQVAHSQAKAKGFWGKERNTGELLMLIVSECGEGLEARRMGRMARLGRYDTMRLEAGYSVEDNEIDTGNFVLYIKDTFEDELADIVIRIADLCGAVDGAAEELADEEMDSVTHDGPDGSYNVGEQLLEVVRMIERIPVGEPGASLWVFSDACAWPMRAVFAIAEHHKIDLWRHIELKLAYNMTRPTLHSKQYLNDAIGITPSIGQLRRVAAQETSRMRGHVL